MSTLAIKKLSAEDEFLSQHSNQIVRNNLAKVMTLDLYKKLSENSSPNGFNIDKVIQTGVDNPGHPFIMTPTDKHKTDLNPNNLKGGDDLVPNYVLSSRANWQEHPWFLPATTVSHGESRAIEKLSVEALGALSGDLKGK
ncbi:creatine kinase, brain a isoform X2 [Tachysurus ichikawai]